MNSSVFTLIGTAWTFYRKHPVLNPVVFWLLFVPPSILDALSGMFDTALAQGPTTIDELQAFSGMELVIILLVAIVLVFFFLWGQASVLLVGQRMIKNSAGRNRTSFSAVRKQARTFIFALFYTELIRTCMTILWGLLFIIPGIIYAIRTGFYDIIIVSENKQGREALKSSMDIVRGRTLTVFLYFLGFAVILMLPSALFESFVKNGLSQIDYRLVPFGAIVSNAVSSFAYMLFMLSSVALFKELKSEPNG